MKSLFNESRLAAIRAVFPDCPVVRRLFVSNQGETPIARLAWRELVDTRHELGDATRRLVAAAEAQGRELTESECGALDSLNTVVDLFRSEMNWRTERGDRGPRDPQSPAPEQAESGAAARRKGHWFRDLRTGREIRGVTHKESLRLALPEIAQPRGRLGDLIASLVRGKPVTPEVEQDFRTMSVGSSTLGGYATPTSYGLQFFDLSRDHMVVMRAGAVMVPWPEFGTTFTLAKVDGDPTVAWKTENSAFTASDVTLGQLSFTARTVGCMIKGSEELWTDSPNIGQIVETSIAGAMALEMDRVALVGSGVAPEPGGIMKSGTTANTDVQTQVCGGTPTTYEFYSRMVEKVRTANFEPNAAVWNARDLGTLDRLVDTTGQPKMPPKSFADLQHFHTESIPDNLESGTSPNDASICIVGQWNQLLIAPRLDVALLFSRESNDGTDSAFAKYQIHVRAVARMDVGIARGAAFCVGTGIND